MTEILDLPDDKLFEICEQMDDLSLTRFGQAYNVCGSIIKQRKEIKLAEELQKWHQSMPYSIFRQIIDKNLDLATIIKNLPNLGEYHFVSSPYVIDEILLLFQQFGTIDMDIPEVPIVTSDRAYYERIPRTQLTDDEKVFFEAFVKNMQQPTVHVIGLNPDRSIKTITIPFNPDALEFMSSNDYFNDYLSSYFGEYQEMMENYL